MNQIKCPHCGETFTIDESNYNSIVKQIRDHEFNEELKRKEEDYKNLLRLEKEKLSSDYDNKLNKEVASLRQEISSLNLKQENFDNDKANAIKLIEVSKQEEINKLKSEIELNKQKAQADIDVLNGKLNNMDALKQLAVNEAVNKIKEAKDSELNAINKKYELFKIEAENKIANKDREIKEANEMVDFYKDLKIKMSTKMLGENLEQHCANEFNKNRMGMFPNAYFEKDNDASNGSKGDFIFKDFDGQTEIISIMFEMKNEADTTSSKHKNEDFFKELDKDRREKNCEYAILVSTLEKDNDLYNEGIVDVSYRYPKMYVIRPQFFIPIITLLRNAALNSLDYKKQLLIEKNNNLDVTHFEENMENFKTSFGRNFELASKKFDTAIEEIDKTIDHLNKVKDALLSSNKNLRIANDKAQDLTIKKLTKNAPSLADKFNSTNKL